LNLKAEDVYLSQVDDDIKLFGETAMETTASLMGCLSEALLNEEMDFLWLVGGPRSALSSKDCTPNETQEEQGGRSIDRKDAPDAFLGSIATRTITQRREGDNMKE
jgi:hypothetical protein